MAHAETNQSSVRAWATYLLYKTLYVVGQFTPRVIGMAVVYPLSVSWCVLDGKRRKQVQRNLQRIYAKPLSTKQLWSSSIRTFISYGKFWYENAHHNQQRHALDPHFDVVGMRHIDAALANGRGAIAALTHVGNLDMGGAWITQQGYKLTVVMETPTSPQLLKLFTDRRAKLGFEVVSTTDDDLFTKLVRAVNNGHIVCLACDRDVTGSGLSVNFFGETTKLPGGPALLALRTQVPIIPIGVYRGNGRSFRIRMDPPILPPKRGRSRQDIPRITQELTGKLEIIIRRAPEQWLVMWPNWPSDETTGPGG